MLLILLPDLAAAVWQAIVKTMPNFQNRPAVQANQRSGSTVAAVLPFLLLLLLLP